MISSENRFPLFRIMRQVERFLSDWRPRRKARPMLFAGVPRMRTASAKLSARSTPPRPRGGHCQQEPARDQKRAAGRRGKREQAVAGKVPQAQIAGEQSRGEDEAERSRKPDARVNDAALAQR